MASAPIDPLTRENGDIGQTIVLYGPIHLKDEVHGDKTNLIKYHFDHVVRIHLS